MTARVPWLNTGTRAEIEDDLYYDLSPHVADTQVNALHALSDYVMNGLPLLNLVYEIGKLIHDSAPRSVLTKAKAQKFADLVAILEGQLADYVAREGPPLFLPKLQILLVYMTMDMAPDRLEVETAVNGYLTQRGIRALPGRHV